MRINDACEILTSYLTDQNDLDILFGHSGWVTIKQIEDLVSEARGQINKTSLGRLGKKRLAHVAIEALENTFRHPNKDLVQDEEIFVLLYITHRSDQFFVQIGNEVTPETQDKLTSRVDELNGHDLHAVKFEYREKIIEAIRTNDNNAGLGILDIAKKSDKPLSYNFFPVENGNALFILEACVFGENAEVTYN